MTAMQNASGHATKYDWLRWATGPSSPLSQNERHACHVLEDYADLNGSNCFPSHATIAQRMGLSARQVQRIMSRLENRPDKETGVRPYAQAVVQVRHGKGTNDPNRYTLIIGTPWPDSDHTSSVSGGRTDDHTSSVSGGPESAQSDHTTSVTDHTTWVTPTTGHGCPTTHQDSPPIHQNSPSEDAWDVAKRQREETQRRFAS